MRKLLFITVLVPFTFGCNQESKENKIENGVKNLVRPNIIFHHDSTIIGQWADAGLTTFVEFTPDYRIDSNIWDKRKDTSRYIIIDRKLICINTYNDSTVYKLHHLDAGFLGLNNLPDTIDRDGVPADYTFHSCNYELVKFYKDSIEAEEAFAQAKAEEAQRKELEERKNINEKGGICPLCKTDYGDFGYMVRGYNDVMMVNMHQNFESKSQYSDKKFPNIYCKSCAITVAKSR